MDDQIGSVDADRRCRGKTMAAAGRFAVPARVGFVAAGVEGHITVEADIHGIADPRDEVPEADRVAVHRGERMARRFVRGRHAGAQLDAVECFGVGDEGGQMGQRPSRPDRDAARVEPPVCLSGK